MSRGHTDRPAPLRSAAEILARPAWGGAWMKWQRWSASCHLSVVTLCGAQADIGKSSDALGRPASSIAHHARDHGLILPPQWRAEIPRAYTVRTGSPRREALQYPFVQGAQPDGADLLAVNAMVPKSLPEHVRADICQTIMLALFEGETSMAQLRANQSSASYFIRKFYRENYDRREISLEGNGDDERAYDEIAAAISRDEWSWNELNDRRKAYDGLRTRVSAQQFGHVYEAEIAEYQRREAEAGGSILFDEAEELAEAGELAPLRAAPVLVRSAHTMAASDIRSEAHRWFDPIWRRWMRNQNITREEARVRAYHWLAGKLGIPRDQCHMELMSASMCRRVVSVCREYRQRKHGETAEIEVVSGIGKRDRA